MTAGSVGPTAPLNLTPHGAIEIRLLLFFKVPKASPIPRARKKMVRKCKRWNDHLVCRLKTVVEQDIVVSLNGNR